MEGVEVQLSLTKSPFYYLQSLTLPGGLDVSYHPLLSPNFNPTRDFGHLIPLGLTR